MPRIHWVQVLGTLPHALTLTLSHSLTHSLTHYYYCSYCYYYGDYCQYCFYFRDYQWLQRMWWGGNRVPSQSERAEGPAPTVAPYFNGAGHVPNKKNEAGLGYNLNSAS